MSYRIACLILAFRSLEELGEGLRSDAFLSDEPSPAADQTKSSKDARNRLRAAACRNARGILETFLDMPTDFKDVISSNVCMCLGYGLYILSYYGESQSVIPDRLSLELATGLEDWCNSSPGRMWVAKFGLIAKRKLQARMSGPMFPLWVAVETPPVSAENTTDRIGTSSKDPRSPVSYGADTEVAESAFANTLQGLIPDGSVAGLSASTDTFTNMQDFFSSGLFVLPP